MRKILDFLRADYLKFNWKAVYFMVALSVIIVASFLLSNFFDRVNYGIEEGEYKRFLTNVRNLKTRSDFERLQSIMDLSIEFHFDPTIIMLVDHHSRLNVDRNKSAWSIIKSHEMMTHITLSLIDIESNGKTFARSKKNAYGLTQLLLPTARDYVPEVTVSDLYDQETNIRIFFMHFTRLLEKYNGNITKVLDAWNRGEGTVDNLLASNINPANGYSDAIYKVALANNRVRISY